MRRSTSIVLVATMALAPGCATIVRGTTQEVTLRSPTPGARILVDGQVVRPGPTELARGKDHLVRVEAEGYEPKSLTIKSSTSVAWAFVEGAFAATGLVFYFVGVFVTGFPLVVDGASGAICELAPDEVVVTLDPVVPAFVVEAPPETLPLERTAPALYCPRCGTEFDAVATFCGRCGAARVRIRGSERR